MRTLTIHGHKESRPDQNICEGCGQPIDWREAEECPCDFVCSALYHTHDCRADMPWVLWPEHTHDCACVKRLDVCTCDKQPSYVGCR